MNVFSELSVNITVISTVEPRLNDHPVNMTTSLLPPLYSSLRKAQSDNFLFKGPL